MDEDAPDTPPAKQGPAETYDLLVRSLRDVQHDRPLTGLAAAGWTVMSLAFTALAGVFIALVLAIVLGLVTQSFEGAGVGAIIGLLLSTRIPARPHRDWRRRLTSEGYTLSHGRGVTDVRLPVEDLPIHYRLHPSGPVLETIWFDLDLPAGLCVAPGEPPTGDLAFDRHLGVRGTPKQCACIDAPIRDALVGIGAGLRIARGRVQIAINREGPTFDTAAFAIFAAAIWQLEADMRDPAAALQQVARGAPFDAAQAIAILESETTPVVGADPDVLTLVRHLLAGDVELGLRSTACPPDVRAAVVAGLMRHPRLVSTDALVRTATALAEACPDDEAGCLEAADFLLAVRSGALGARLVRLGDIGALQAALWLGRTPLPAALQPVADRTRAAIQQRLHLDGALTLEAQQAGAVTVVDTGQLSAPDGSMA